MERRQKVSATAADVETTLTLPASPRLILLGGTGQVTTGRRWMITLEGRVIFEGITPTFLTGLAAVFAIYYVLNLQYQEEAACTLVFIQRLEPVPLRVLQQDPPERGGDNTSTVHRM
ncbi:hypothetical protein F7725_017572 [Dissostichus mawsoni]|uniref:Uncharacterized protein n=1 Tax=Dissostichus mawsoni TaxID=36200 RepID=A0A7J5Z6V6_DISMA|nr:hypothetical protein F7725_017572 [Dissostichus mawsoni]